MEEAKAAAAKVMEVHPTFSSPASIVPPLSPLLWAMRGEPSGCRNRFSAPFSSLAALLEINHLPEKVR
jgi:hypothetical protein